MNETSSSGPGDALGRDARLLFATRIARLFAYGFLSVVLVLYLVERHLSAQQIGLLLTLTLAGDTLISLALTTRADRFGRRRTLLVGAVLMVLAGILFVATGNFWLLLLAATIGVLSPSGYEVGPFLAVEQAALVQNLPSSRRTHVFAWYNLVGSFATAGGSLAGGILASRLVLAGFTALDAYRAVLACYALMGLGLAALFARLSPAVEAAPSPAVPAGSSAAGAEAGVARPGWLGLGRSRKVVLRLSGLFFLDAFGGGFVIQSIVAYWFHVRFGLDAAQLGTLFFGANLLAGVSALSAAWVARHLGLVNTMVFTHLPSNVLLMLVPAMPTAGWAIGLLLARFSISQMDVPTRQSYTMAVVEPEERSAAAGVTGIARTLGASLAPIFTGPLLANPALMAGPFVIAGAVKIAYDLLLYRSFRSLKPPEESGR
jgi:MFS family permease